MSEDPLPCRLRALVARRTSPEGSPAAQLDAYRVLPSERRRLVRHRLLVIDAYRRRAPSVPTAQVAAARLGMLRRSFWTLMERMERHGPVIGLDRGRQRVRRPSVVTGGLAPVGERRLRELVAADPYARFGDVARDVASAMAAAGEPAVSDDTLRRRLVAIRGGHPPRHLAVGGDVVVAVRGFATRLWREGAGWSWVALLVDAPSGLVLGSSLDYGCRGAVRGAVEDAAGLGAGSLAAGGIPYATRLVRMTWHVPDDLGSAVEVWTEAISAMADRVEAGTTPLLGGASRVFDHFATGLERRIFTEIGLVRGLLAEVVAAENAESLRTARPLARTGVDDGAAFRATLTAIFGRWIEDVAAFFAADTPRIAV